MLKSMMFAGAAALALTLGSAAHAADPLEARVAELEAALAAVKAEMAASKAQQSAQAQDIIRLETKADAPAAPPPPPADGFRIGSQTAKFGGFIKLDAMVSRYHGGDPANGDALREFYLPGSIPVGAANESAATDFNARQTRFWLTTEGKIAGHKVGSRIEMDFQVLPGAGDQRTTSPANPALRRAFVTVDGWLVGQEWTAFQNTNALPESADYIGPSEGTVFVRQAQVRYTHGPLSLAVENPETTVTPFHGGTRLIADDNSLPDFTARYVVSRPWGEVSLAGLARQLRYQNPATAVDATAFGWGLSLAGKVKLGKDDLRFMVTGGDGIGRYVGLNFANDAVLNASNDLEPIGVVAGYAAYRHAWTPAWRSSLIVSYQEADNPPALTGPLANAKAGSVRGNLIWSPAPGLDVGGELSRGRRELVSGADGDMSRLQFFVKYGF